MNNRIKEIRKSFGLNQTEFGERLGIKQTTVAGYETGAKNPMDSVIKSICREFGINEEWLRFGTGNMRTQFAEQDEQAIYVSELLEGSGNPFCQLIIEIMATYKESSPESQKVLRDFSARLRENLEKKKES